MRLIDAEKLHCEVKEHCKKLIDKGVKDVDVVDIAAEIGALLQDAQTVDAVPVVNGRWEYSAQTIHTQSLMRCGICGWWTLDPSVDGAYHYCPNCGAKMDVEGNNEVD